MINGTDLEAFGYYEMVDAYPETHKSVQQMVEAYNTTAENKKEPELYNRLIAEEYKEYSEEQPCTSAELKELVDLVYVIYGYAWSMGWNFDEAVRRVHENNMARMYQDDGTIKRREDGKIIKNPNTPKVNLEDLV